MLDEGVPGQGVAGLGLVVGVRDGGAVESGPCLGASLETDEVRADVVTPPRLRGVCDRLRPVDAEMTGEEAERVDVARERAIDHGPDLVVPCDANVVVERREHVEQLGQATPVPLDVVEERLRRKTSGEPRSQRPPQARGHPWAGHRCWWRKGEGPLKEVLGALGAYDPSGRDEVRLEDAPEPGLRPQVEPLTRRRPPRAHELELLLMGELILQPRRRREGQLDERLLGARSERPQQRLVRPGGFHALGQGSEPHEGRRAVERPQVFDRSKRRCQFTFRLDVARRKLKFRTHPPSLPRRRWRSLEPLPA